MELVPRLVPPDRISTTRRQYNTFRVLTFDNMVHAAEVRLAQSRVHLSYMPWHIRVHM